MAGLRTAVGLEVHAEGELVEVRGLRRVADDEADGVHGGHRERVAAGVVLDEADQLLELLEGEVGLELVGGEGAAGGRLVVGGACRNRRSHGRQPVEDAHNVQQYVEILCNLSIRRSPHGRARRQIDRSLRRSTRGSASWRRPAGSASRAARSRRASTSSTEQGVITGWGPELSAEALGYPVTAFLTLEIRQDAEQHGGHDVVGAHLAAIPEVLEAHTITGAGDLWARVVARSNTDLQRVIDLVLEEPGDRAVLDRDRAGHAGPLPGAAPGQAGDGRQVARRRHGSGPVSGAGPRPRRPPRRPAGRSRPRRGRRGSRCRRWPRARRHRAPGPRRPGRRAAAPRW